VSTAVAEPTEDGLRKLPPAAKRLPDLILVAAALGMVLGLVVVQQLGARSRNALLIAEDAAVLVESLAGPIAGLPRDIGQVADGVSATLAAVRDVAATASTTTGSLADALDTNIATTATATADVADRVADVIEAIERFVPGDVESLAEELRAAADGLEPVPEQLAAIAGELRAGAVDLDATLPRIEALEEQLGRVIDRLDDASLAVQDLPALAADVRVEAADARTELDGTLWLLRLLVVLTGLAVAAIGWCLRLVIDAVVPRRETEPARRRLAARRSL
jgi:methyl-accepting chemotaxis protein